MTVNELIKALSNLPNEQREMIAWVDGCDCSGAASGELVVLESVPEYRVPTRVIIMRDNEGEFIH